METHVSGNIIFITPQEKYYINLPEMFTAALYCHYTFVLVSLDGSSLMFIPLVAWYTARTKDDVELSLVLDEPLHPRPVLVAQVVLELFPFILVIPCSAAILAVVFVEAFSL